ncbi:hypothetical protein [Providencia rettgeri]|uniref:hypothetical protein n=1 Tax=Providencia rettgeri TaxID=587 RepID=UPI001183AA9F|nr:hypothetical protein [Providencia rettgeri]
MREPKPTQKPVPSFDIKDGVSYFCPECSERNQRGKSQLQVVKDALQVLHRMGTEELVATLTKAGLIEKDGCDFNHVENKDVAIEGSVIEILSDCAKDVMRNNGVMAFNQRIECDEDHGSQCILFQVEPSEAYSIGVLNNDLAELIVNRGIAGLSAFAMFERGSAPFYSTVGL